MKLSKTYLYVEILYLIFWVFGNSVFVFVPEPRHKPNLPKYTGLGGSMKSKKEM